MKQGTRTRTVFVCQQCGNESAKWFGKCPACGEFETLVEVSKSLQATRLEIRDSRLAVKPVALNEIESKELKRQSTGFAELDRVLGGGLIEGQVVLLAGEPGIGKSTLLLQVAEACVQGSSRLLASLRGRSGPARQGLKAETNNFKIQILYVCAEESPGQIKLRAERLGVKSDNIVLYAETNVEGVIDEISRLSDKSDALNIRKRRFDDIIKRRFEKGSAFNLVIVDSIQSLESEELTGIPGAVGQVRLCSQKLINACKSRGIPLFLVGQVTKEGTIAGPKVLEHTVDTVLYLEGERMEEIRLLRCFKNRFGSVDELAVWRMGERGLEEISDASRLFLEDDGVGQPGAVLCPVVAGLRILLVEVQSLVVATQLVNPRRISQGFSRSRVEMIAAVLQKHLKLPLYKFDIYINVSGGLTIDDPAADLPVALAIYSSLKNKALSKDSCAFGELTLLSSIRPVLQKKKRVEEAKRLGLKQIYSSDTSKYLPGLVKRIFS